MFETCFAPHCDQRLVRPVAAMRLIRLPNDRTLVPSNGRASGQRAPTSNPLDVGKWGLSPKLVKTSQLYSFLGVCPEVTRSRNNGEIEDLLLLTTQLLVV